MKRDTSQVAGGVAPAAKKPRINVDSVGVTINSVKQLDATLNLHHGSNLEGLGQFRLFLESIIANETERPAKSTILCSYLDLRSFQDGDDQLMLQDLLQTWSKASADHEDHVTALITAILRLLLRVLDEILDDEDRATNLCKSILKHDELKPISRCLNAPKHKVSLVTSSTQLLTAIVGFRGGKLARQLYAEQDATFSSWVITRNLSSQGNAGDAIRVDTVDYVLAHFRYQNEGARMDILQKFNVIKALFAQIKEDAPQLTTRLLDIVLERALLAKSIPQPNKRPLLSQFNLGCIAGLYRVRHAAEEVVQAAHRFLTLACTSRDSPIRHSSSGWYSAGFDADSAKSSAASSRIIDSMSDELRSNHASPNQGGTLARFTRSLRPHANALEQELLISILTSSPELVDDYFCNGNAFRIDPRLSSTWMGQISFLYKIMQLPVPRNFGRATLADTPPPAEIALQHVLPRPLSQEVLTKCLNVPYKLIKFATIRLLLAAFAKMRRTSTAYKQQGGQAWVTGAKALRNAFSARLPPLKTVLDLFYKSGNDSLMEKEAVSRLLAHYFSDIPEIAVNETIDVSSPIVEILWSLNRDGIPLAQRRLLLLQLQHLMTVAQFSPNMRWWNKPDSLKFSPFVEMLRLAARAESDGSERSLELIEAIVIDHYFFSSDTQRAALEALIQSLERYHDSDDVLHFLDNCTSRLSRQSQSYWEVLESLPFRSDTGPMSPLVLVMQEQWPFVANKRDGAATAKVASWIASFLSLLSQTGEDRIYLQAALTDMIARASESEVKTSFEIPLRKRSDKSAEQVQQRKDHSANAAVEAPECSDEPPLSIEPVPEESENRPELLRWMNKDLDDVFETNGIGGKLLLCLCSSHQSIRLQAVSSIAKLAAKLQTSTFDGKQQVHLLLSELLETVKNSIRQKPLHYVAGVFACKSLDILTDPTHFLYGEINRFLQLGPSWKVDSLPSYWVRKILLESPEDIEHVHDGAAWLADYLRDSLRTFPDLELCRRCRVFERIATECSSSGSTQKMRESFYRVILRAIAISGAEVSIRRIGLVEWAVAQSRWIAGPERRYLELILSQMGERRGVGEEIAGGKIAQARGESVDTDDDEGSEASEDGANSGDSGSSKRSGSSEESDDSGNSEESM